MTAPPPVDGDDGDGAAPPADGGDQGTDSTTAGTTPSHLARTGVETGTLAALIALLGAAGAGTLALRRRLTRP